MTPKIDPADVNYSAKELGRDYLLNGQAEHVIADRFGVSRAVVGRWLREAGIERRGTSQAGLVRAAKMSPKERLAQAAAAHDAVRGRTIDWEVRCRQAYSRELRPREASRHERTFARWLTEAGTPFRREVAIGPYNADFTVGPIAVEILGGEWHLEKVALHRERTPYILDQGWRVAFVWSTANCPLERGAVHHVITWANQAGGEPSSLGEYRVIRGDGHLIASGRCEDGQFAGIPPARRG